MNAEKLAKLQADVRIGGKGTPRRKKKVVHKTSGADDKKLQSTLKKFGLNVIPGIEEVTMFRDDGKIVQITSPKVSAAIQYNTFQISGNVEIKDVSEMLPQILQQLGADDLKRLMAQMGGAAGVEAPAADADDDVPELVENFEEAAEKKA
eukprot:Opistho-2@63691